MHALLARYGNGYIDKPGGDVLLPNVDDQCDLCNCNGSSTEIAAAFMFSSMGYIDSYFGFIYRVAG